MFQLPDSNIFSEDMDEVGLVLLDVNHYEKNDIIVLWIPNVIEADQFNLQVSTVRTEVWFFWNHQNSDNFPNIDKN